MAPSFVVALDRRTCEQAQHDFGVRLVNVVGLVDGVLVPVGGRAWPARTAVWGDLALLFAVVGLGEMGAQAFIYFQF